MCSHSRGMLSEHADSIFPSLLAWLGLPHLPLSCSHHGSGAEPHRAPSSSVRRPGAMDPESFSTSITVSGNKTC